MGIPLLVIAFPPLLVLYPTSYALWILRTVFARRVRGPPKLLSDGGFVDPRKPRREHNESSYAAAAAAAPLAERIGKDTLAYCADVLVWETARAAIFASDPGRPVYDAVNHAGNAADAPPGKLIAYDLDTRALRELTLDNYPPGRTLHPLGLGLRDEDGNGSTDDEKHMTSTAILAVANLGPTCAAVDMFRLTFTPEGKQITTTYIHSLENTWLGTPRAVVPISEESVLVTNAAGFSARRHWLLNAVETMVGLPLGCVLHLSRGQYINREEGTNIDVVARGLCVPAGLALSPDGRVLVVSGGSAANVHVYDIVPPIVSDMPGFDSDNATFRETIPVGFTVAGLRFFQSQTSAKDGEYTLLAAGHPVPLQYAAAARSRGVERAPSRVVKIAIPQQPVRASVLGNTTVSMASWFSKLFRSVDPRVQTVFEDDGRLLSTSSAAAGFIGQQGRAEMLVTGLWDGPGALHCIEGDI